MSEEHKQKISDANKGDKAYWYGKKCQMNQKN